MIEHIGQLTPDPANARKHNPRNVGMLVDALHEVGAARSIVIDENGVILAGNATIEAAAQAGIERVRVIEADGDEIIAVQRSGLSKKAKKRLALFDNRVAELAEWEPSVLAEDKDFLDGLFSTQELDILLAGLIDEPQADPGAQLDRAKELQEKWQTARGQLWQVGRHRLLCGDSTSADDRERLLGGLKPNLLHTDPPYGIGIVHPKNGEHAATDGGSKPFGSTGARVPHSSTGFDSKTGPVGTTGPGGMTGFGKNKPGVVGYDHAKRWTKNNQYLPMEGDTERCTEPVQRGPKSKNQIIVSNMYPVIEGDDKPFDPAYLLGLAPIVIVWGANYYADKLPPSSCWICWDKREDIVRNTFADCELAWCSKDAPARIFHHLWNGLHKGSQHGERRTHPTEKPVALFAEIGKTYADKGVWLDLYAGTGAQIVAAEQTGATCLACEIEPLYCAVILERLSQMGIEPKLIDD